MKKILTTVSMLAFVLASCHATTVKWHVDNFTEITLYAMANQDVFELKLDAQGNVELNLDALSVPTYVDFYYAQTRRLLYLEPGDDLAVTLDANDPQNTFSATGDKAAASIYLNKVKLTDIPESYYKEELPKFLELVEKKESMAVRLMKANKLNTCGSFDEVETGRIHYSYLTTLLMYPIYHKTVTGDTLYTPDQRYYDVVQAKMVENAQLIGVPSYRTFLLEAAHIADETYRSNNDYYEKAVGQMAYLAEHFTNDTVRQNLIHYVANEYVKAFGVENIQDMVNIYNTFVTDEGLQRKFSASQARWNITAKGNPSPDFSVTDINGKTFSLKDFAGKYLYIDMWATWCMPCRKELPHLKAIESKMEGRNITFLSISVDKNRQAWEKAVNAGNLSRNQVIIDTKHDFLTAYRIKTIPRFILLDPQGRIVNADMTPPSSDELERILLSLSGM